MNSTKSYLTSITNTNLFYCPIKCNESHAGTEMFFTQVLAVCHRSFPHIFLTQVITLNNVDHFNLFHCNIPPPPKRKSKILKKNNIYTFKMATSEKCKYYAPEKHK